MTLYVKGTSTRVIGTLEQLSGTAKCSGFTDDGRPKWFGGTDIDWDAQRSVLSRVPGKPTAQHVFVDEDGGTHTGDEVEDRRDDGTIVAYGVPGCADAQTG